jgi:hypothetical protein
VNLFRARLPVLGSQSAQTVRETSLPRFEIPRSIELGKVSVGIEIANELASALDMPLSDLIHLAE